MPNHPSVAYCKAKKNETSKGGTGKDGALFSILKEKVCGRKGKEIDA